MCGSPAGFGGPGQPAASTADTHWADTKNVESLETGPPPFLSREYQRFFSLQSKKNKKGSVVSGIKADLCVITCEISFGLYVEFQKSSKPSSAKHFRISNCRSERTVESSYQIKSSSSCGGLQLSTQRRKPQQTARTSTQQQAGSTKVTERSPKGRPSQPQQRGHDER